MWFETEFLQIVHHALARDASPCCREREDALIIPTAIFGLLGVILLISGIGVLYGGTISCHCLLLFPGCSRFAFYGTCGKCCFPWNRILILCVLAFCTKKLFLPSKTENPLLNKSSWAVWILASAVVIFTPSKYSACTELSFPCCLSNKTIEVLDKLNEVSQPDDFLVTWWDYGSGCWFFMEGAEHSHPLLTRHLIIFNLRNLRSRNPIRSANLARLKTETYVDVQESKRRERGIQHCCSGNFRDGKHDLSFYQGDLFDLEQGIYPLPKKTRDMFLFLPYEILRIFPTILSFSSRNLYFSDGQAAQNRSLREPPMKILRNGRKEGFLSILMKFSFRPTGNPAIRRATVRRYSYSQLWVTSGIAGDSARIMRSIDAGGFQILSKPDSRASRAILYVEKTKELVLYHPALLIPLS